MCTLISNRRFGTAGVVALIVLGACASVGGSQAPADMQRMTSSMILSFDNVMDKKCSAKKIIDAKFEDSHSRSNGKRTGWSEIWQLDRCGKVIAYSVNYERKYNSSAPTFRIDIRPKDEPVSNAQYVELLARRNRCEPIGDAILISQEGDLTKYRMGCKNGDMLFQCKLGQQSSYPSPCSRLD